MNHDSTQQKTAGQGNSGQKQMRSKKASEKKDKELQMMHLKVIDRVLKWPMVDTVWHEGNHVYGKIKGFHVIFTKTFELAEKSCLTFVKFSMPLLQTLETPITAVDNVFDKGLKKIEEKVPLVKGDPTEIYYNTVELVMVVVQPPLDMATTVLQYSKGRANTILATTYGNWAVTKIDKLSAGAEKLIDRFCKLTGEGETLSSSVKTSAAQDPLMHVVETVGSLFGIFSRRVLVKCTGGC